MTRKLLKIIQEAFALLFQKSTHTHTQSFRHGKRFFAAPLEKLFQSTFPSPRERTSKKMYDKNLLKISTKLPLAIYGVGLTTFLQN